MQKKLTISIDEKTYYGLHALIGQGNISRFLEQIVKPYLFPEDLANAYRAMAADKPRETEAQDWVDSLTDSSHETR